MTQGVKINREELLADIRETVDSVAGKCTLRVYNEQGSFSKKAINNHFGTWDTALREAGVIEGETYPDEKVLVGDIQRVRDELDRVPSQADYEDHGYWSVSTVKDRFGYWSSAVEAAGFVVNRRDGPRMALMEMSSEDLGLSSD